MTPQQVTTYMEERKWDYRCMFTNSTYIHELTHLPSVRLRIRSSRIPPTRRNLLCNLESDWRSYVGSR